MGRKGVAKFLLISLALSVIPAVQNNYTEPTFATAQAVDNVLSTEQKRLINQTALRIVNTNPSFVGNATIPSPAATTMVTALAQVIERIVVQTSNPDQIITHLAIETAANPTGPLSQALLLFAKQLAVGDTIGVSQLTSLIAQLTESPTVNATTQPDITGNISQLIMQQAFQSALGANLLLNQIANKLAANSSKLSVNNVTISPDTIAQTIQQIIIQVSLQQQGVLSFQPLLFIANQVSQNPLGPLSKSIVQLAQLQITGGVGASESIAQSISELVKQILYSATGNITESTGTIPTTEPTSEDQSEDTRTKIIIRDEFDEREPPTFQPPPPLPQQDEDNQTLVAPTAQLRVITEVTNEDIGTKVAEDFSIYILNETFSATAAGPVPAAPPPDGTTIDLALGTYKVVNLPLEEYGITFEGDCDSTGTVTLAENEPAKRCTVKLDDRIPGTVKVVIDVINDNGGNKTAGDFPFDIVTPEFPTITISSSSPTTFPILFDRVFSIKQDAVPGYTTTFEGDCTNVAAVENQTNTCTIKNDDVAGAQLRVITEVINDDGGTKVAQDFGERVRNANGDRVGGSFAGAAPPDGKIFDLVPGTFHVEGIVPFEYLITFEGDCDSTGTVTLAENEPAKRCTVKLDDRILGTVKVVTDVINDNGGNKTARDFRFDIIRPGFLTTQARGAPPPDGNTIITPSESYTISQDAVPGYTTTLEGDCTNVAVVENQTKTCTIKNDDIVADDGLLSPPPTPITGNQTNATLIVNTRVVNNFQGVSVQPQYFGATVDVFGNNRTTLKDFVVAQIPASDGSSNTFSVPPGSYTINFSPGPSIANFLGNYSFASTCPGPQVLGANDTKTCFAFFRDIAQPTNGSQPVSTATLSVKTHVINDNTNSTLEASDVFMLLMLGQIQQLFKGSEEGIPFTLPANTSYLVLVPERQITHTISRSGDCGELTALRGATPILAGEIKSCTITLDDSGVGAQIFFAGNATLQNLTSFPTTTSEKETICDDGIDNDNDVKVDGADEDCLFITSTPTTPDENTTTTTPPSAESEQAAPETQGQQPTEQNNPPTADAGEDSSVESGKIVKLNGKGSNDPDANQVLSYLWEQISSGSPSVSLDGENEEVASFKAPEVDKDTKFKFELTVKDGNGGESTDSVTVAVLGGAEKEEQKEEQQAKTSKQEQDQQEAESSKTSNLPPGSPSDEPEGKNPK